MEFCFYPQREHNCPKVGHGPHLGGAALGSWVMIANTSDETIDGLHKAIDVERERNTRLVQENLRLDKALEQAKLELKLERQYKFATRQEKHGDVAEAISTEATATTPSKKRGAPLGHPDWFRPKPTSYDWPVDVPAPRRCPHCRGRVTAWLIWPVRLAIGRS